ncbi:hypothetical protein [Dyella sp. GSA-30]|uniref:hypothetical protein n=1 Tax=Dyella sp. GSA-30 TaxID=2994496 RepID=UPI002490E9C9|nr:hypothetical protein [Dyella sp. GSA-30]BDU21726.1 hypothetical protein DYGSA30_31830 [Dyella sp. GSA-30]
MTFTDLQAQLAQARAQGDAALTSLMSQREQLRSVQQQIATLKRLDNGTGQAHEQLLRLQAQADTLSTQLGQARQDASQLRASAVGLLGQLAALEPPQQQIEQLVDTVPILLFPVRIETRFQVASQQVRGSSSQLWVRIYPDDCQIDTFESMLSATEVTNATAFWIAMWRAGNIEAQERGAWSTLVSSSGSGRAAYVIQQFAPINAAAKPTKTNPQDVVLVIVPQITVSAAEQTAAFAYWIAVWSADGATAPIQNALTALQAAVGNARADQLIAGFAPDPNGWDPPTGYTRAQVNATCAVLELPASPVTKTASWTQAAKAFALPDRFAVLAFNQGVQVKNVIGNPIPDGLATTPDPSLPSGDQITVTDDDVQFNDDLRWIADFDHAVAVGMGIKIDLTTEEAVNGFDRLLVVGMRFSSDQKEGQSLLQTLITHQCASKGGYSLVPQGSPTNNTDGQGAAYSWVDDPDAAYDTLFKGKDEYADSTDPLQRSDGEWFAKALGIDDAIVKRIPNAGGFDQAEARAMNVALWNGTLGYMFEEMLSPVFSKADVASTRQFFTRYVSGRGALPAFRVGKQPYGLLPAMTFANYHGPTGRAAAGLLAAPWSSYLQRLHTLLLRLDGEWKTLSANVAHIGQSGDPHQLLLDIIGLNSGSVEYHQRYAESFDQLYNKLVLELGQFFGGLLAQWLQQRGEALLTQLGADPTLKPAILQKFFYGQSAQLTGPVVDDVPLSESTPVRAYTADNKNYIQWLAGASLDVIRRQDFGGNAPPNALLYLMLRHSMMLSQWDTGVRFLESHGLASANARLEPAFINVQTAANTGESKFNQLYQPQPAITGGAAATLADYVLLPAILHSAAEAEDLNEVVAALGRLAGLPTARLERLFTEHIDCCSYRLDAWKAGLVATRLEEMRAPGNASASDQGIYLGAFGWLEDVRPRAAALEAVRLEGDNQKVFQRPGDAPLKYDIANAGFIHAPSLNQAATAAILKNAYRVNASPAHPDTMAVNLTSERVRQAQTILEGMRNGQTLPALLGYRFERGLHDDYRQAEVDKFIYPLRQAFPLAANKLKSTQTDGTVDISLIDADNVIDGQALINRTQTAGNATYPFGLTIGSGPGQVPAATSTEQDVINAQVDALRDLYDALGDMVMAESVYQVVLGNFERSAAVSKSLSSGAQPPDIQVVDTPRSGVSLTHRVALHLDPTVNPATSPSSVPMTPRATAEAPLNAWLATNMPPPASVVVSVSYSTPALSAPKTVVLTQADLGLQPIDLLYVANLDLDQAMGELDDRIVQAVRYGSDGHPDMDVSIQYLTPVPGKTTFFELAAMVRSLRKIILQSRTIGPTDMTMPLEAKSTEAIWDDAELASRVDTAIAALTVRRDALVALQADASALDDYAHLVTDELLRCALHGIAQAGTGQMHGDMRSIYDAITVKLNAVVTRWQGKSSDFAALMATWPSLATDPERFALLKQAERLIMSNTTATPPADPNVYKATIDADKTQFDLHLSALQVVLAFNGARLVDYANAVTALEPTVAQHDATPLDISDQQAAITNLRVTIVSRITAVAKDLTTRITAATTIVGNPPTDSSQSRVQQLLAAAKQVLGDEAQIVPRFVLSDAHGTEFNNAWTGSSSLLTDVLAKGRQFPVDDWLYGVARVRSKLGAWENLAVLSEAFGAAAPALVPLQLPFTADDRWMALEFDAVAAGQGDHLLYTAHFAAPFDPGADQCGLLIDEWLELVPASDVLSGLTFHFERPNSQPPQAALLVLPSVLRGHWQWDDLVGALNDTLDAAKARAVEPAQIDTTDYASFLPATMMAVTLYQITIATNLALNNNIYARMGS